MKPSFLIPWLLGFLVLACPGPDRTPPGVTIISPAERDSVRGTITVQAHATDNDRVVAVLLFVDDSEIATDSTGDAGRFEFSLNTSALETETTHTLFCVAFDPAGNSGTSSLVTVFVFCGTFHNGIITTDETWTPDSNPHIVRGELMVKAKLLIQPGVEVQMSKGAAITISSSPQGLLYASGTRDSAIVFTSSSLSAGPGDWQTIRFAPGINADTNTLRHCIIEYGGAQGALVGCTGNSLAIDSCRFRHSRHDGVATGKTSRFLFHNNSIDSCAGFPVLVDAENVAGLGLDNSYLGNGYNGIGVNGGALTVSSRWGNPGFPYFIRSTVDIAGLSGPCLTIAPGCSLLFGTDAFLRVGSGQAGSLIADGSSGRITFSSFPADSWPGIEFWDKTMPGAEMRNCLIDHAGGGGVAAIVCSSPVSIIDCEVRNSSSDGIFCSSCGFSNFTLNTVSGCHGYPLSLPAPSVGTIGKGNHLSGNFSDSIEVLGGQVTCNSQWRNQGIPYLVKGMVGVGSVKGPTLVIDQGTVVAFEPNAALVIGQQDAGNLSAIGVPDSIIFTATHPEPGAWRGIEFEARTGPSTTLDHCRVLYAGREGLGILYINTCAPTVSNNEIAYSPNCCIFLMDSPLDPDSLREFNWLHDWNDEEYDDIEEEGDY